MKESSSVKNKRILKNTIALYFRTFITLIVGLYTSRVMLEALGVDNYGIFYVVGGITSFGAIITGAISTGCSRFITYSLGEGNPERMRNVFSTTVNVQIILSFIVFIALEIGGLWFLNTSAKIPEGSLHAAHWVLQCSIVIMILDLVSVPYSATIIAHEHMSIYAYSSILSAALRLAICFLVKNSQFNHLIFYSILLVGTSLFMRIFYGVYCSRHFEEAKYRRILDKELLKEMASYSGWIFFGQTAMILNSQGINILVNVFFGILYNAARGIAFSVRNCVQSFINNFTTALNPQIVKSYANKDLDYCFALTNRSDRLRWLMTLIFLVPIVIETETILKIWLGTVPEYAVTYLRFAMFESLALAQGSGMVTLINAAGKMKRYQLEVTAICVLVFPLSWIAFKLGMFVWIANILYITIYILMDIPRFMALKRLMNVPVRNYISSVWVPCIKVSIVSFSLPLVIAYICEPGYLRFFLLVPISVIWTLFSIYLLGIDKREKSFLINKIRSILKLNKKSYSL